MGGVVRGGAHTGLTKERKTFRACNFLISHFFRLEYTWGNNACYDRGVVAPIF